MIKINLIERKREQQQKKAPPKFLITWALITGACFLVTALAYFGMEWHLSSLADEKKKNEQEIASLKKKIEEVQRYEKLNKDIEQKVALIENLRASQAAPVKLLDEMSTILTATEGVWLASLNYSGDAVNLDGSAFSNEALVSFVDRLKSSPKMADVTLIESNRASQDKVTVYKFKLQFKFKA